MISPASLQGAPASVLGQPPAPAVRVAGLDTIRFVCALCVCLGHFNLLHLPPGVSPDSVLKLAERLLNGVLLNGVAAVIVFFIISGFCIHYPNVGQRTLPLGAYFAQRFLRILPPIVAVVLLGRILGYGPDKARPLGDWQLPTILWSLVAEMIYYSIYPLLRLVARRFGLELILAASYLAAAIVIGTHPRVQSMHNYGYGLTWLVGLPCWILGCVLAESWARDPGGDRHGGTPWLGRLGVLILSMIVWQILFRAPSFVPPCAFIVGLHVFAVAAYFWLRREISWFRGHQPPRFLEWGGAWSYSLYLFHELGKGLWLTVVGTAPLTTGMAVATTLVRPILVLALCYGLFLLVERPSHRLAKSAGRALRDRARLGASATV